MTAHYPLWQLNSAPDHKYTTILTISLPQVLTWPWPQFTLIFNTSWHWSQPHPDSPWSQLHPDSDQFHPDPDHYWPWTWPLLTLIIIDPKPDHYWPWTWPLLTLNLNIFDPDWSWIWPLLTLNLIIIDPDHYWPWSLLTLIIIDPDHNSPQTAHYILLEYIPFLRSLTREK